MMSMSKHVDSDDLKCNLSTLKHQIHQFDLLFESCWVKLFPWWDFGADFGALYRQIGQLLSQPQRPGQMVLITAADD
jgi:hypothetical protein